MMLFHAVQVDRKGEVGRGPEEVKLLFQKKGVGAQINELLALRDASDNVTDFLVQKGFSAGDGDHGCAAFVDGLQAFLEAEALVEDGGGVIDLAAPGAGEVAAE